MRTQPQKVIVFEHNNKQASKQNNPLPQERRRTPNRFDALPRAAAEQLDSASIRLDPALIRHCEHAVAAISQMYGLAVTTPLRVRI